MKTNKNTYYLDNFDLIEGILDGCEHYYNIKVNKEMIIPFIYIGRNEIYVFMDISGLKGRHVIKNQIVTIQQTFHFVDDCIFIGMNPDHNQYVLIHKDGNISEIEDIYEAIQNCHAYSKYPDIVKQRLNLSNKSNIIVAQSDLCKKYGIPPEELTELTNHVNTDVSANKSSDNCGYYIDKIKNLSETVNDRLISDEEGHEYKKHAVRQKITGLVLKEQYFRYSDEDEYKTFYVTLFCGVIGLHHFMRGDFIRGLLYLCTGGGFGILYLSDVVQLLFGNYSYSEVEYVADDKGNTTRIKETVYVKPIKSKYRYLAIPLAVFIGISMTLGVVSPLYVRINKSFSEKSVNMLEVYTQNIAESE